MWKRRELQVRNLADLSHWLLNTPQLKADWGEPWWKAAFEACGSPSDWNELVQREKGDPRTTLLLEEYQRIDDRNQLLPRARVRRPIDPNELDLH